MIQLCEPLWMAELRNRLEAIDLLEDGWNGEGPIAPIMRKSGGWDVRVRNAGGQHLDEFDSALQGKGAKDAAHGISLRCM
jgi:hypothetical protein